MKLYDCLIIGGGPAGLSAAIYTARFNRSVLLFDSGNGRWNTHEINENYLGFPQGIATKKLHQLGYEQAQKYGTEILKEEVISVKKSNDIFEASTANSMYSGKSIILATGVTDDFSHIEKWKEYLGKTLFVCITCDGYKTKGKRIVVVGHDDDAVCTAMQFRNYTEHVAFVTNKEQGEDTISTRAFKILKDAAMPFHETVIEHIKGSNGIMESILLSNDTVIDLDFMFSEQGKSPNVKLAKQLYIKVDQADYIYTDNEQRTNIPFVYAAGDVTKAFAHQVGTAVHEGSMAAQSANYDLYAPEQRI